MQIVNKNTQNPMANLPEKVKSYLLGSVTDYWNLWFYFCEKYFKWICLSILEGYAMKIIKISSKSIAK